ncbi:hypothetical protein Poli38472_004558 [Pythium oligandrum]|uniref:Transmembrane protein n=1 Tax=Pythium oligandrum TaxID=41045 RepID=A0A8K1FG03_PYTOL|nr:hypothetical protein Poli38472_004558 [Pythium oligandrum]|eukprot:TMW59489.1 hypothetical protein Poli38472_004558 [Pythium oligandrum]
MDVTTKSPEHREEELPLSGEMDSDSERAYGTFEVSVIEVEPEVEEETKPLAATTTPTPPPTTRTVPPHAHRDHTCAGDCCALVSLVWIPFRWQTYKVMLFHVVSLLFALGASLWTIGFHLVTLPLAVVSRPRSLRDVEIASVHRFLTWDAQLFNWVAPETERVMVFNASPVFHDHDDAVYALYPQIYFGVAKLVCSSVPSIISVVMYVWSIQRFVAIVTGTGLPDAAVLSAEDDDLLILLSVVGIYASAVLMTTVATIARHITVFFCAEFLLYAS